MLDFLEGRATGRLLRYDPATRRVAVVLDYLMFANGVALGPGDEYVLVNETLAARITRYWLRGPKAGQSDIFASALPGYPDNLTYNGRGMFWVALPSSRNSALEALAGWPWLRKVVQRLPAQLREQKLGRMAWVLGIDTDGQVVHNLQDPAGRFGPVTSVIEVNGRLYFGSIGRAGHRMGTDDIDPADAGSREECQGHHLISQKGDFGPACVFTSAVSAFRQSTVGY
jgi:hypothetical protein